jgi:hypothetical protein
MIVKGKAGKGLLENVLGQCPSPRSCYQALLFAGRRIRCSALFESVSVFSSLVAGRLVAHFAFDNAVFRLSVGIALLLIRVARSATVAGFTAAVPSGSDENDERNKFPQIAHAPYRRPVYCAISKIL